MSDNPADGGQEAVPPRVPLTPQYIQTPAQPYPSYGYGPAAPRTNTLAIIAFIVSFFVSIAGIICGHIALGQIKRTGEGGRGLALAGTIIGYVFTGLGLIGIIFWVIYLVIIVAVFGAAANSSY